MLNFSALISIAKEMPLSEYRLARLRDIEHIENFISEESISPPSPNPPEWTRESAKKALDEVEDYIRGFNYHKKNYTYQRGFRLRQLFKCFIELQEKDLADRAFEQYVENIEKETRTSLQAALYSEMAETCLEIGQKEQAEKMLKSLGNILKEHPNAKWPEEYGTVSMYKEAYKEIEEALRESPQREKREEAVFREDEAQNFINTVTNILNEIPPEDWPKRDRIMTAALTQIKMTKMRLLPTNKLSLDPRSF